MLKLREIKTPADVPLRVAESVQQWGFCTLTRRDLQAVGVACEAAALARLVPGDDLAVDVGEIVVSWMPKRAAWK